MEQDKKDENIPPMVSFIPKEAIHMVIEILDRKIKANKRAILVLKIKRYTIYFYYIFHAITADFTRQKTDL